MRTKLTLCLGIVLAMTVIAAPAQADDDLRATIRDEISQWAEAADDQTFKVYWNNGLNLATGNGDVQMRIGGLLMIDHYFVDDDEFAVAFVPDAAFESGAEIRRARLHNGGLLFGHVEWMLEMEFADPNDPVLADAYIGLVDMDDCFGCLMPNIRVGHQRVTFGLERLTPLKFGTFMNRSTATDVFTIARRYGVTLHDEFRGGQLGYQLGWFSSDTTMESDGEIEFDEGYALSGRVWYTPWYDCACSCRRLHVGVGAMTIEDTDTITLASDGPVNVGINQPIVGGTLINVDDYFAWNVELALVYGPWSIQGEFFNADVESVGGAVDVSFTGWYVQASYWLTGECRNWGGGVFGRTSPCCNFLDNDCCCYGGLELAARYSSVDMNDGGLTGGEVTDWVIGLNWHLNPNARIQLNYMNIDADGPPLGITVPFDESMTALGIRWQVDW